VTLCVPTRINKGEATLVGVLAGEFEAELRAAPMTRGYGTVDSGLPDISPALMERIHSVTKPFFNKYDSDKSGKIEIAELSL
jgi:hypothetical protein